MTKLGYGCFIFFHIYTFSFNSSIMPCPGMLAGLHQILLTIFKFRFVDITPGIPFLEDVQGRFA